jgi:hypothetical protein
VLSVAAVRCGVPGTGIEPARRERPGGLSPVRLPITPPGLMPICFVHPSLADGGDRFYVYDPDTEHPMPPCRCGATSSATTS